MQYIPNFGIARSFVIHMLYPEGENPRIGIWTDSRACVGVKMSRKILCTPQQETFTVNPKWRKAFHSHCATHHNTLVVTSNNNKWAHARCFQIILLPIRQMFQNPKCGPLFTCSQNDVPVNHEKSIGFVVRLVTANLSSYAL